MPEHQINQDTRLKDLWERRKKLTPDEFVELYQMVYAILQRYANSPRCFILIQQLPYLLEDYIQEFVAERILGERKSNVDHAGALCFFFRHFLLDHLNKERIPGNIGTGGNDPEDGVHPEQDDIPLPPGWQAQDNKDEDLFYEVNLTIRQVEEHALNFLTQTCTINDRIMLRRHYCTDRDDEVFLRMNLLAERYDIPAYHYRVRQIGLVVPGALHGAGENFFTHYAQNTALGRWFTQTLGIEFTADNKKIFFACLKILCDVTLRTVNPTNGAIQ